VSTLGSASAVKMLSIGLAVIWHELNRPSPLVTEGRHIDINVVSLSRFRNRALTIALVVRMLYCERHPLAG
jgi:hypothetical protein